MLRSFSILSLCHSYGCTKVDERRVTSKRELKERDNEKALVAKFAVAKA